MYESSRIDCLKNSVLEGIRNNRRDLIEQKKFTHCSRFGFHACYRSNGNRKQQRKCKSHIGVLELKINIRMIT